MKPRTLLQMEGLAVLLFSVFAYHRTHGSWVEFLLLFLVPDLSMIGYLLNSRVGAVTYNVVHTYLGPVVLAGYALGTGRNALLLAALIWFAHIGFDRLLGFGLKYQARFKDTHLDAERLDERTGHPAISLVS
jgi:hypothetical protein